MFGRDAVNAQEEIISFKPKLGREVFKPLTSADFKMTPDETLIDYIEDAKAERLAHAKSAAAKFAIKLDTTEALVQDRGAVYGHPLDDFGRAAKLKEVMASIKDPVLRHAAEMICVKLARLCQSPEHLDSWDDIGGYAKTGRMVIEERKKRSSVG